MAKSNKSRELSNAKTVLEACGDIHEQRTDGYQNMLTKYGTKHDSSTAFSFVPEELTDDYTLGINYQFNGLFAKIIDLPAGEAVSKGFKLNINNADVEKEIMKKCAKLNLEENLETAIKWSRLYGGAIAVMLIYDGRGLDEPLNYKTIRGIDEIKVYEAAVVNPLFSSSYYSGEPEFYQVNALEGTFTVHASRCLPFRNGKLPQQVVDSKRRVFGFAEYDRIKTALRETVTSHGYAPRMLERAIQSIIKIKDLANLLATSQGEDTVVRRLQLIDMARSMFNSMAIDADGEDFDFKSAPYSGVKEILDSTCNMLSAVTNIPQALLFGSSPQGMDATGHSDLENYYNYVGQIQKRMVKAPLETLLGIIIQSLVRTGKIEDYPEFELEFNPLWSLSESEQAQVDLTRAQTKLAKAQTAQLYVDMQSIDAIEIRTGLAKSEEYDVETLLDDVPNDELFASMIDESSDEAPPVPPAKPQGNAEGVTPQSATEVIPQQEDSTDEATAAAVLVVNSEGKILCGVRSDNNLVCGPGGHIEAGEQPIVAAIRETQEEFGITPTSLVPLATLGENNALHHKTDIFFCTSFSGTPKCDGKEMKLASFITLEELLENRDKMFKPFLDSLEVLESVKKIANNNSNLEEKPLDIASTSAIIKIGGKNNDSEKPESWITVNGNHIPVDENGKAIGGQMKALQGSKESGEHKLPPKNPDSKKGVEYKTPDGKTVVSGSAAAQDCTFSDKFGEECQSTYNDIRLKEPEISRDMVEISSQLGSSLQGLEYSVKTASSLEGKIERKIEEAKKRNLESVKPDEMLRKMGDIVRYTQVCEVDDLPDVTLKTVDALERKGYKVTEIDNKYLTAKPGDYKGIHIQAVSPNGVNIEMQLHSQQSFDLKMQSHKLYEVSRDINRSEEERNAAREEMRSLLKKTPVPKNIEKVKSKKKEVD